MKKKLLSMLCLVGSSIVVQAQVPTEMTQRFQTVMDSLTTNVLTNTGETIGLGYAVYLPGYGSWQSASGVASPGVPLTVNATMGIASHSKLYTAVILLKLQEAGLLSLDDTIGQYFDEPIPNVDMTATVRQLLKHEAGIFDPMNDGSGVFWDNVFADYTIYWDYADLYTMIETPFFEKGTAFRYCNVGYAIAANIIENVTGNSYSHNLHQYITTPLELNETFDAAEDTTALDAMEESQSYILNNWWPRLGSVAAASLARGNGSIVATPKDVIGFYKALFHDSFLSEESMHQLLDFESSTGYGLGIKEGFSSLYNQDVLIHGGDYVGFLSEVTYDRKSGAISFLIINSDQVETAGYGALHEAYMDYYPKKINDAGISRIVSPRSTVCAQSTTPVVILKNFGSAPLTNTIINYQVDNATAQTFNWIGNIASGQDVEVTLPALTAVAGNHNLKIWTTAPNGGAEENLYNDSESTSFSVSDENILPSSFTDGFEGPDLNVNVWNPNHLIAHQWGQTELSSKTGNGSLVRNNFENQNIGTVGYVDLPMLHLASGTQQLSFTYAYSALEGTSDSLEVLISEDCGSTWTSLFNEEGVALSQGRMIGDDDFWGYFPQTDEEWHTETISLDAYEDSDILVRFKQVNDGGGNIFLDDIQVGNTLGITDLNQGLIKVYPNPATDKVIITGLVDGTKISLYSIAGQKLLEVMANGDTSIDISKLTQGIYFLNTDKGSSKIIKK